LGEGGGETLVERSERKLRELTERNGRLEMKVQYGVGGIGGHSTCVPFKSSMLHASTGPVELLGLICSEDGGTASPQEGLGLSA